MASPDPLASLPRPEREVYTVSRLNREARFALESGLGVVWVEGEISNFARPASGHMYFSLKDDQAQVRCAMFRMRNHRLSFAPRNGLQVLARARVSLYEARGEYQLVIDHLEPAGEGALRLEFERLKQRLAAEGLFDTERKQPLPTCPRAIGVITSATGAALRDILSVLRRRCPWVEVVLYPVPVQGEAAAPAIVRALALAARRQECDSLLLARGGGSLEDLRAFNDERVARALAACPLPVVSGVGHETDFTIVDLVADLRAPTPSAAAELAGPDGLALERQRLGLARRLALAMQGQMRARSERLVALQRRLAHPGQRLQQMMQRLDELGQRRDRAMAAGLAARQARLATLSARLAGQHPAGRLQRLEARLAELRRRADTAVLQSLEQRRRRLALAGRTLHAVSPLATLERGYAIVRRPGDGTLIRDSAQTAPGELLEARLARGRLGCRVEWLEGPDSETADGAPQAGSDG